MDLTSFLMGRVTGSGGESGLESVVISCNTSNAPASISVAIDYTDANGVYHEDVPCSDGVNTFEVLKNSIYVLRAYDSLYMSEGSWHGYWVTQQYYNMYLLTNDLDDADSSGTRYTICRATSDFENLYGQD